MGRVRLQRYPDEGYTVNTEQQLPPSEGPVPCRASDAWLTQVRSLARTFITRWFDYQRCKEETSLTTREAEDGRTLSVSLRSELSVSLDSGASAQGNVVGPDAVLAQRRTRETNESRMYA